MLPPQRRLLSPVTTARSRGFQETPKPMKLTCACSCACLQIQKQNAKNCQLATRPTKHRSAALTWTLAWLHWTHFLLHYHTKISTQQGEMYLVRHKRCCVQTKRHDCAYSCPSWKSPPFFQESLPQSPPTCPGSPLNLPLLDFQGDGALSMSFPPLHHSLITSKVSVLLYLTWSGSIGTNDTGQGKNPLGSNNFLGRSVTLPLLF